MSNSFWVCDGVFTGEDADTICDMYNEQNDRDYDPNDEEETTMSTRVPVAFGSLEIVDRFFLGEFEKTEYHKENCCLGYPERWSEKFCLYPEEIVWVEKVVSEPEPNEYQDRER
ncbi:MAG TPA: hypothetical protein VEP90_06285 [Methylomirabilota bacterium]|nr:hypothetical protein [Methylomirabilota bacterium]